MTVAVNDVEVGRDLLSNKGWPFGDLVAYASRGTWVRPGDVLGSGTCGNGGCLAELWRRRGAQDPPPLQPGDMVTMTLEGIGTISSRVVAGIDAPAVPPARPIPGSSVSRPDGTSGRLVGKVVVTGAGQGQCAAETRLFAAEGATVIGLDLGTEPAEALPGVDYRRLDVTDPAGWHALSDELARTHQRTDGLVANAGITWRPRLVELDPTDLARVMAVNVTGALLAVQTLSPRRPPGGSIVIVGSVAALTGHFPAAYTMSKWALRGLTKAACLELGPRGIRVNAVHPGYIETPMTASAPAAFRATNIAETPLGRVVTVDEVAPAPGAVPAQRRCLVHQRRGDPGGRRNDRSRGCQVHQRRRSAVSVDVAANTDCLCVMTAAPNRKYCSPPPKGESAPSLGPRPVGARGRGPYKRRPMRAAARAAPSVSTSR